MSVFPKNEIRIKDSNPEDKNNRITPCIDLLGKFCCNPYTGKSKEMNDSCCYAIGYTMAKVRLLNNVTTHPGYNGRATLPHGEWTNCDHIRLLVFPMLKTAAATACDSSSVTAGIF